MVPVALAVLVSLGFGLGEVLEEGEEGNAGITLVIGFGDGLEA